MVNFDIIKHLNRQFDWSKKTFGPPSGVDGVMDHLGKEILELSTSDNADERRLEWIDIIILAADGFMRDGGTPETLIESWVQKQAINENRSWPNWRTATPGKAIEHIRP